MIGDATESWTAIASQLHIYVKDVVKSYRNAIDAGGVSVMEPSRKDGDPDALRGKRSVGKHMVDCNTGRRSIINNEYFIDRR